MSSVPWRCAGLQHLRIPGINDRRGYEAYAVPMSDGLRIYAGCHNFTIKEALAHYPAPERGAMYVAAIKRLAEAAN